MALRPTLDARFAGVASLSAASTSFTVTIGSQSNRILVVGVTTAGASAPVASSVQLDPTGANLALTRWGRVRSTASGFGWVDLWYLVAPPTGTWTLTVNTPSGTEHAHGGEAWYNVDQTTPWNPAGPHTISGTASSNPSLSITTAMGEMLVGAVIDDNDSASGTLADASGQTRFFYKDAGSGNHQGAGADKVPSGTTGTLGWSGFNSTLDRYAAIGGSLRGVSVGYQRLQRNGGGLILRNAGGGILTDASDPAPSGPTADSSLTIPVSPNAAASAAIAAASSQALALAAAATAAVAIAAASAKTIPMTAAATATAVESAQSTSAIAFGTAAAGTVATHAASSLALNVGVSNQATVTVQAASSAQVPLSSQSAGAVALTGATTAVVPMASSASGTALVTANATGVIPLTGSISGGAPAVAADSGLSVAIGHASTVAVLTSAVNARTVAIASAASGVVLLQAASGEAIAIAAAASGTVRLGGASTLVVPLGGASSAFHTRVADSFLQLAVAGVAAGFTVPPPVIPSPIRATIADLTTAARVDSLVTDATAASVATAAIATAVHTYATSLDTEGMLMNVSVIRFSQYETGPLTIKITDADGNPVDLSTLAAAKINVVAPGGAVIVDHAAASGLTADGAFVWTRQAQEVAQAGSYVLQLEGLLGGNRVEMPTGGMPVNIVAAIAAPAP